MHLVLESITIIFDKICNIDPLNDTLRNKTKIVKHIYVY